MFARNGQNWKINIITLLRTSLFVKDILSRIVVLKMFLLVIHNVNDFRKAFCYQFFLKHSFIISLPFTCKGLLKFGPNHDLFIFLYFLPFPYKNLCCNHTHLWVKPYKYCAIEFFLASILSWKTVTLSSNIHNCWTIFSSELNIYFVHSINIYRVSVTCRY